LHIHKPPLPVALSSHSQPARLPFTVQNRRFRTQPRIFRVAIASPSRPAFALRRSGAPTAKLDSSPPPRSSTLHVQRKRSNTDNLRERSVSVRISQARGEDEDTPNGGKSSPISMLMAKGYSWKATKARLPQPRHVVHMLKNPRFLLSLGFFALVVLLWRSVGPAAGDVQRYVTRRMSRSKRSLSVGKKTHVRHVLITFIGSTVSAPPNRRIA
jgi:hypothetical protein